MGISGQTVTTVLAVWGAVMSTVALGWNIVRDRNDRAKVKVNAAYGFTVGRGPSIDTFSIEAVNTGRRPVHIVEASYETETMEPRSRAVISGPNRSYLAGPPVLPKTLGEGERVSEIVERASLHLGRFRAIYVKDATGKKWKASRSNLRSLNRGR